MKIEGPIMLINPVFAFFESHLTYQKNNSSPEFDVIFDLSSEPLDTLVVVESLDFLVGVFSWVLEDLLLELELEEDAVEDEDDEEEELSEELSVDKVEPFLLFLMPLRLALSSVCSAALSFNRVVGVEGFVEALELSSWAENLDVNK